MKNAYWGKAWWHTIHSAAIRATTAERRQKFVEFMYILVEILPCDECIAHARANLKSNPITRGDLVDNVTLFLWTYKFHDLVNRQLNAENINNPGYTQKTSPPYDVILNLYSKKILEECSECVNKL